MYRSRTVQHAMDPKKKKQNENWQLKGNYSVFYISVQSVVQVIKWLRK